jgi:endonuclease/exonuclease/phosphatase family metal-dependent hydrolase
MDGANVGGTSVTAMVRITAILLVLVSLPAQLRAASFEAAGRSRPIVGVVTQNQYFGADLTPLLAAPPDDVNAALLDVLEKMAATDFPARAQRQARAIARQRPDLVALQEVLALGCIDSAPMPPPEEGCHHPLIAGVVVDFLEVTLEALKSAGAEYRAVAAVENLDTRGLVFRLRDGTRLELPGLPLEINGYEVFITAVDRDVILARKQIVERVEPVEFPDEVCRRSLDGCNYAVALPLQLEVPGGTLDLSFERGFVAVDAKVPGHRYRFVNTHLETLQPVPDDPASRFFQAAQAAQLISVLETTTTDSRNLIVAGDINSSPEDQPVPGPLPGLPPPFDQGIAPPYVQFIEAGFTDVWTLRSRPDPGFTCCQAPDLLNELSLLDERIDVVLTRDMLRRASAKVIGDRVADKTPSGLWPSDHAGVAARLLFWPGPAMVTAER